jgi:ceramide glucosyltransferase
VSLSPWGIALALAAGLLVLHLVSLWLALPRTVRLPGRIGRPGVTLIRPVMGQDPHDRATLASSFVQDHPDYRIIFCAPSEQDPACDLVRDLMAAHPHVRACLLTGEDVALGNPKLRNVSKGWQDAQTDWVCMADSNLLLPPEYLSRLCDAWGPDTGLVSGPPAGIWPEGWGGHLECAFLNANQARLQLASARLGRAFAQGKTLFFHRPMINSAGGLRVLDACLAEDVAATRLIRGLGLRVTMTPDIYHQPVGRRSLRQVWDRQLRWARIRRDGFPHLYAAEVLNGALVPVALCAAGVAGQGLSLWIAGLFALLWYGAEAALAARRGWPGGWRAIAALPLRDLMLPLIWLAGLRRAPLVWRGNAVPLAAPSSNPAR